MSDIRVVPRARKPIQDLYQLKLIVKIVLKPQDYLFVVAEMSDCFVSSRKRNVRERYFKKFDLKHKFAVWQGYGLIGLQ